MIINIRVSVKKLFKERYNIDPEVTEQMFESGILKENNCKSMLLINEYKEKIKPKEGERLRFQLAEKYCISERQVRKIIYESIP